VNYELPNVPEDYVHRIGRTARAGASGQAVSLVSPDEATLLRDIERTMNQKVAFAPTPSFAITPAPAHEEAAQNAGAKAKGRPRKVVASAAPGRNAPRRPRRRNGAR